MRADQDGKKVHTSMIKSITITLSDKSDTSVSIIKINFLAIVINFLESPKERKLQSKRYRYL